MQTIKCFEVLGHTDTTEGRGPMKVIARFSTKEEAEQYVKSKHYAKWCVWGQLNYSNDRNNIKEALIIILDNISELDAMAYEQLRQSALAKLSKQEREALGI